MAKAAFGEGPISEATPDVALLECAAVRLRHDVTSGGVIPTAESPDSPPVMPAHAGIHDLLCCNEDKSWIPAFAGMTGAGNVRQYFGPLVLHMSRARAA
jgi:hypothetical protein